MASNIVSGILRPIVTPLVTATPIKGGGVPVLPGFSYTKEAYSTWVAGLSSTGCAVEDLGLSEDGGSTIYGLQYGDAEKPVLFLLGQIHGGHEWQTAYVLREFMSYLAAPPAGAAGAISRILDKFQVYCIPCANPYGYINTTYRNANDVNLNRNFDVYWSAYDDTGDNGTKGASAFSEAETQIVRDKVLSLLPLGFVDYHVEGSGSGARLEVMKGGDESFWTAAGDSFNARIQPAVYNYTRKDALPQSQQWVRQVIGSNGHKPMTSTFEMGETETDAEKSRLGLNFALQFCLSMVDQVNAGWPQGEVQTVTITPFVVAKNTTLSEAFPDGDYGELNDMSAGTASSLKRRALIEVVAIATDVPPGADLQSAELTLYCNLEDSSTDKTVSIYKSLKQWWAGPSSSGATPGAGVDASTWSNRNHNGPIPWGAPGGQSGTDYAASPTDSVVVTGTGAYFDLDVLDDVVAFASGADDNFGWFLINDDESSSNSRKRFRTAVVDDNFKPSLTVTYR